MRFFEVIVIFICVVYVYKCYKPLWAYLGVHVYIFNTRPIVRFISKRPVIHDIILIGVII